MKFESEPDIQKWLDQFGSSLGTEDASRQFARWQALQGVGRKLEETLSQYPDLSFSEAQALLDRASQILRYDEEYWVVIIGETGAGKSTLLNALLQDRLLLTGGGAAITGTAVYVYPDSDTDHDKAEIFIREQNEFKPLLLDLASRYFEAE